MQTKMSAIDNYGEFDLPEEKTEIEVVEDPLKFISSSWEIFKINTKDLTLVDCIYQKAEKIFEGKEKLKVNVKEVIEFLSNKSDYESKSLFLSALHNETNIKTLLITDNKLSLNDRAGHFGYKLKKDKNIILGKKTILSCLGFYSKGNVITRGDVYEIGRNSSGININLGVERWFGRFYSKQENIIIKDNIQILSGSANMINLGKIGSAIDGFEGNVINLNKMKKPFSLKSKLDEKLKEIYFLKSMNDLPEEEQIQKVESFDFNNFKNNITAICEEIYQVCKPK